jgi:hypothetical protein
VSVQNKGRLGALLSSSSSLPWTRSRTDGNWCRPSREEVRRVSDLSARSSLKYLGLVESEYGAGDKNNEGNNPVSGRRSVGWRWCGRRSNCDRPRRNDEICKVQSWGPGFQLLL